MYIIFVFVCIYIKKLSPCKGYDICSFSTKYYKPPDNLSPDQDIIPLTDYVEMETIPSPFPQH